MWNASKSRKQNLTTSLNSMRLTSDLWFNKIPRDSKRNDRVAGRTEYDQADYINTAFLFHLQTKQQNKCYYCWSELSWMERRTAKNGLTVERINSTLPHIRSNCVLACKSCNSSRFTRKHGLLKRYFTKWRRRTFDVPHFVEDTRSASFL